MTNDNNTRSKANAVFFSVIMVISMVAVGFAAAPAAAQSTVADDTVGQFNNQIIDSSGSPSVSVTANVSSTDTSNRSVVVTYVDADGNNEVAGFTSSGLPTSSGSPVTVSLSSFKGASNTERSGTYTAHVVDLNGGSLTAGNDLPSGVEVLDSQNGFLGDINDGQRSPGDGDVYDGDTIYQGEDNLNFINTSGGGSFAGTLTKDQGDDAGTALSQPLDDSTSTGTYSDTSGFSVTVQQPRITTAEVQVNGGDVDQVGPNNAGNLDIVAEWNFPEAENLAVTVEDSSGTDITGEVVGDADDVLTSANGEDSTGLDLSNEEAGEYTVIFEGNSELDDDFVVEEYTIELTNQDTLSISADQDPVTQGTNNAFTISGGTNGQYHLVTIESGDFRSDTIGSVFRNVGDTSTTGFANDSAGAAATAATAQYAYAVMEIDGTTSTGSINTQALDDSSVTLDVYTASGSGQFYNRTNSGIESEDDSDFDVEEGDITLDNPSGQYTVGSSVTLNGTAETADNVRIYARNNADWEPVLIDGSTTVSVDSDDTFEEEDIVLSGQSKLEGNDILSFEGNYDLGVIDASDVTSDIVDTSGGDTLRTGSIGTSDFSSASSSRTTINVQQGALSAEFSTINGQVALADGTIDVDGTAEGQDEVLVIFVDNRGNTVTRQISVDDDGAFEQDDIVLDQDLNQGTVSAHVFALGRDNEVGDGQPFSISTPNGATIDGLDNFVSGLSGSGDQVRSRILDETVDGAGSDDLFITSTFRLNDATLSIDNVYPDAAEASGINPVATGETLVVEGTTNRQSDNAAITFEMLTQEDESVTSTSTDEWGNDGQFSATIDTSNIETGTYVLEADDGESTDRVTVEIVEERQTDDGEDGQDGEDGADDGEDGADDGADDGEDGADDGEDGADDGEDGADDGGDGEDGGDGGTDDSTPGFGALVALVALIAAALLATRRDN